MNKTYRIEFVYGKGRKQVWGYTLSTLEQIEKAMKDNIKTHPIINVYAKTGTKVIATYQG